ncbi:MAG: 2'-deoxycytidine 5'-triphosphate deaminase [DPANN group archaeon]|nr:2'-deoxycytidine 5'-triphosphate deaminase [DPANN group archaeon]
MLILSDADYEKFRNILRFYPQLKKPGPASQDLHIEQIRTPAKGIPGTRKEVEGLMDAPAADFFKRQDRLELRSRRSDRFWMIKPGQIYFAKTVETVVLPEQFQLNVQGRSSLGRLGLRTQHIDDKLEIDHESTYEGRIYLMLASYDKPVLIRPNDRICQAVVYSNEILHFTNEQLAKIIESGAVSAAVKDTSETPINIFSHHALGLRLGKKIIRFRGDVLDPKVDNSGNYFNFDTTEGFVLDGDRFYLGASLETVGFSDRFAGMIREVYWHEGRPTPNDFPGIRMHSGANFIDPGFNGTITYHLYSPIIRRLVKLGEPIAEVDIFPLMTPCKNPYKSKYQGQQGPTPSKGHADYTKVL